MKEDSGLKNAMEKLAKELEQRYAAQSTVKREGNNIILPSFMSYHDAADAILSYEKEMETVENKALRFKGHPDDMLVALYHGMVETFGHAVGETIYSFFGNVPGAISVAIGYEENVTVPYGKINIPGLPVTFNVSTSTPDDEDDENGGIMNSTMQVIATCKRKFMPLVDEIEKAVKKELKTNSIFKTKAIDSRFRFLNINGFDVSKVVHSVQEGLDLEANVLQFIKNTAAARKARLNLKRTILFHGPYGTGKTISALVIAKTCQSNGWTFINVLPGDPITPALNFAKKYQPSVVFFEDIDQITDGERDSNVNEILNTIDGILSKNSEVITVLTTNHVEKVERAMLRPGRVDALIELGKIDEKALDGLIKATVGGHVDQYDAADLLTVVEGYTPAFVVEGCQRALLYAIAGGRDKINHEDLRASLHGMRSQYNLMMSERTVKKDTLDEKFTEIVRNAR